MILDDVLAPKRIPSVTKEERLRPVKQKAILDALLHQRQICYWKSKKVRVDMGQIVQEEGTWVSSSSHEEAMVGIANEKQQELTVSIWSGGGEGALD